MPVIRYLEDVIIGLAFAVCGLVTEHKSKADDKSYRKLRREKPIRVVIV